MNKNINAVVELTEKELACVCGGGDTIIIPGHRGPRRVISPKKRNQAFVL